jgi:hypothetical protein
MARNGTGIEGLENMAHVIAVLEHLDQKRNSEIDFLMFFWVHNDRLIFKFA